MDNIEEIVISNKDGARTITLNGEPIDLTNIVNFGVIINSDGIVIEQSTRKGYKW
jgi:hypothetical protein